GPKADHICHVAAADDDAAATGGEADELSDPADRLRFDLRRRGSEQKSARVRVDRRREKLAEYPDGRGRRRDVAEEPRMLVEEGVIEEQRGRILDQRTSRRALLGQGAIEI